MSDLTKCLTYLLNSIGSWTHSRWDQHLRSEFGDERTDAAIRALSQIVPLKDLYFGHDGPPKRLIDVSDAPRLDTTNLTAVRNAFPINSKVRVVGLIISKPTECGTDGKTRAQRFPLGSVEMVAGYDEYQGSYRLLVHDNRGWVLQCELVEALPSEMHIGIDMAGGPDQTVVREIPLRQDPKSKSEESAIAVRLRVAQALWECVKPSDPGRDTDLWRKVYVAGLIAVGYDEGWSMRSVESFIAFLTEMKSRVFDEAKEREAARASYWNENTIVCFKEMEPTYIAGWLAHARRGAS